MKERITSIIISLVIAGNIYAAVPNGYYNDAVDKNGSELQSELARIISHSDPGYDNLWEIYKTTDRRSDGKVWDMYSNTSDFTFGSDQCGNYGSEGDCYNREHSIPKSWRGGSKYSDAHMVIPTDGYVNNRRGNYPFGEVGASSYVSDNSFSKLGTCKTSGYSGTVFEPNDEYKGDFARIYFYAATRYHSECGSWSGEGFSGIFPHLDEWTCAMMLRWHRLDPVSQKEIDRNDAVYETTQGNRNPFVDYPELVDLIFGEQTTTPFQPDNVEQLGYLETPINGDEVHVGTVALHSDSPYTSATLYVKGVHVKEAVTLRLDGSTFFNVSPKSLTPEEVIAGANVTITYTPDQSGVHTASLTLSGDISHPVVLTLTGEAVEGFVAVDATHVYDTSFQANWVKHSQATDYELAVWSVAKGDGAEHTVFDVTFANGVPSGWSKTGYTNVENNAVRLASGSNDGAVITSSLDMSSPSSLTITCSPYKTSDNSVLYILVDDVEVAQIDCATATVTETITLQAATVASTITLKAVKGHRVYLQTACLTVGGGATHELLEGYPVRVGDVDHYTVDGLYSGHEYSYNVTAYSGNTLLAESNVITLTTGNSDVNHVCPDELKGVYIYAYNRAIYVDDAPRNACVNIFTIDGRLCASRLVHASRQELLLDAPGIYLVQVVTATTCRTQRVAVN